MNKLNEQDLRTIVNCKNKNCTSQMSRKKNSVLINEPYKFDGNLILAWSNAFSFKKGYKTAGTTNFSNIKWNFCVVEGENNLWGIDSQTKFKSPHIPEMNKSKLWSPHYHSERNEWTNWNRRYYNKNDTLEDTQFDSNRDISPYRVENFLEMLHKFGISDSTLMKKLMNSPMSYQNFSNEMTNDMQHEISQLLAHVFFITN